MKLEDLRPLSEKATPGPWVEETEGWNGGGIDTAWKDKYGSPLTVVETGPDGMVGEADKAFIVAAVNFVRELLEMHKWMEDENRIPK